MNKSLLLINLGTPDKPTYFSVFKYLRQFLMDGRVININPILFRANKSEGLITEFKDDDIRFVMSANAERDQFFFHPGIAAGFLSRLYLHTNEKKWLELAKLYMLIAEKSSDYLWHTLRAGKVAWGNALLYRITKEKKYYDMAIRAGKNIISQ